MDMRLEADNLERLDANFAKVDDISFPRPRPALTSADVLVKAALSAIGVKAVCKMIFHDNLLHGDMHPGNILVTDLSKPSVCFLDAGICAELGDTEHQHFVDVLAALMRHDGDRAGRLMIAGNERFETLGPREEAFFQKIGDYTTRIFAEASRAASRSGLLRSTAIAIRVMAASPTRSTRT
ncbi:ABC1 family protein [Aureococcus anophagefferens]|uniref:ABC1 family protein n=1 Tax=Aureococcus anophagefferens TaxID=44056 RepID=A0ABR1G395_AURAN